MRTISLLLITLFCYLTANSQTLVEGGQFMDLIMPMNGSVASDASVWGDVKPRWTDNGVEDNVRSYWGGNIVRGEDGKYHMYIAGWPENSSRGHATWSSGSRIYHVVSDNVSGPYVFVADIGAGHNPEIYKTGDTYVIYKISQLGYYKSKSLGDVWETGKYEFDLRGRNLIAGENRETSLSNCTFAKRQDGSFLMVDRGGSVWISRDGLTDAWHQITDKTTYSGNRRYFEDPVIWRDHLQYHMIVNDWNARIAYYNRSLDGHTWVVEAGAAYSADETKYPVIFSVHADGTQERWHKYERPKVFQDSIGRAEFINFAVIDTEKSSDLGGDSHSSKNIVMPLVKPLIMEVLNEEPLNSNTTEIKIRIKAEDNFNPNVDLDLPTLVFGAHGKVNYGLGFKVSGHTADGNDMIVTFSGSKGESGITEKEFAPKMLGRKTDGTIAVGYAKVPNINYLPPMLSALRPDVSLDGKTIEMDVENYGLSSSEETTIKVYDTSNTLIGETKIVPVAPFGKCKASMAIKSTVKNRLSGFTVVYYNANNKEVAREFIPNDELIPLWDKLQSEINNAKQLLNDSKYTNGKKELQAAIDTVEPYLGMYNAEAIEAALKSFIKELNAFKMSNASPANGVLLVVENSTMDAIEPWTVLYNDATDKPGFKINAKGANYGFTGNFMEMWVSSATAFGRANYAWQTIEQMPAGRYRLKAKVIARRQSGGTMAQGVSIFLNEENTSCATNADMAEEFSVILWMKQEGALKFGLNIEATTNANWVAWDNVELEYFGTEEGDITETDRGLHFNANTSYYFKNASSTAKYVYISKPQNNPGGDNTVYRTDNKSGAAELTITDAETEGQFYVRDVETGLYLSGETANASGGQWMFTSTPATVVITDNTSSLQSSWKLTGDASVFYLIGNGADMFANAYKASSGDKVQSYKAADQGSQWYIISTGKTIDTGIAEIGSNNIASKYYTLSGTPVSKPNKGLYIEHAKGRKPRKVMVK